MVVKLHGWDADHAKAVAQASLSALKQLIMSDKKLPGNSHRIIGNSMHDIHLVQNLKIDIATEGWKITSSDFLALYIEGKKSLYIRLGCRGDWPDIKPPGWDPSTGDEASASSS